MINESKKLNISGKSTSINCMVEVEVNLLKTLDNITQKDSFTDRSFSVDPQSGLSINLDHYYGGANLKFALIKTTNPDFNVFLKHVTNYQYKRSFKTA